jgi:hypothetical protein
LGLGLIERHWHWHLHHPHTIRPCAGSPDEVTLTGATVNGTYNEAAKEFRLVHWLQQAGLLEPAPAPEVTTDDRSGGEQQATAPTPTPSARSSTHRENTHQPADSSSSSRPHKKGRKSYNNNNNNNNNSISRKDSPGSTDVAADVEEGSSVFMRALCEADSSVQLKAEARLPGTRLVVASGSSIRLSAELR